MADTTMFFQLVSQRLLRSDSSFESMGSTMGMERCRARSPIGLAYRSQACIRLSASDSVVTVDITVSAFLVGVLDAKVIIPPPTYELFLSISKVRVRAVLAPAPADMKSSIVLNFPYSMGSITSVGDGDTPERDTSAIVTASMNCLKEVASVKKSGFCETQPILAPVTGSTYGMDQWVSCIPATRFVRRRSRQLLYLFVIRFPIISLYGKKNAAAATAA